MNIALLIIDVQEAFLGHREGEKESKWFNGYLQ